MRRTGALLAASLLGVPLAAQEAEEPEEMNAISNEKGSAADAVADIEGAHNYLLAAIDEATAGQAVSQATTQPYGCSVKYKN
jgi:hypothetical protein